MRVFILVFLISLAFGEDIKKFEVNSSNFKLDMVYNLPLNKYQKFLAKAVLENGDEVEFVSVKSMLQVYFNQDYFLKKRLLKSKIKKMFVKDYLDGSLVDAKEAFYVFGSRLVGPHGDDLIPLKNKTNLELFKIKYGGTKVLKFDEIKPALIKYLDM
ncbi:MAG: hypothetical protein GXN91_03525 [Epsilonproteobacteria bacterium]|nr:hypothetical protein [Campylobacterota bacterium]